MTHSVGKRSEMITFEPFINTFEAVFFKADRAAVKICASLKPNHDTQVKLVQIIDIVYGPNLLYALQLHLNMPVVR